jgi:polysaccharide deacetylase family protein (PEP-CTERM system associated)
VHPVADPATGGQMIRNAISVDVEDWFHVGAFETTIARGDWDSLDCRVERNTDAVLALFEDADVTATFFILGWVAARYPKLIKRIADQGHEIASHGWDHIRVFTMTPEQFARDLSETRKILEDTSGERVTGYRAPSFSIDKRTPWAHAVLADAGYAYSSSVAPVIHDHYGWPEAPRFAFKPDAQGKLIELPVTTARFAGRTIAAGGGGFFRLLPYAFSRWAVRQVNAAGQPAVIYFHPWEIDPDQPRVGNAPLKSKFRHYTNLRVMAPKLRHLMQDFDWGRVDEVIAPDTASLS